MKQRLFTIAKKTVPHVRVALIAAMLTVLGTGQAIFSQGFETPIGTDVDSDQWKPVMLENFEKANGWKAVPTPYDPTYMQSRVDQKYVDGKPSSIQDTEDNPAKKVFGVKFQFRFPGYNFVTIFPPVVKDDEGKDAIDPVTKERIGPALPVPGVAKKFSVWVMSQGKKYKLEAYIRDWKGNSHRLIFKHKKDGKMAADLDFVGWRPMIAEVPSHIPQEVDSYPKNKGLKFIKFIVRATPRTSTEPAFVFFDELKVLTNQFDVHFDGAEVSTDWGGKLSELKGRINNRPDQEQGGNQGGN